MPSSSFVVSVGSAILSSLIVPALSLPQANSAIQPVDTTHQYTISKGYSGSSFFDGFDFLTSDMYIADPVFKRADPTNGFVNYVDQSTAINTKLITFDNKTGNPVWGVDTTRNYTLYQDRGRPSIRIESKDSWTHGFFVADIKHMPGAACGVWPAFWTLGSGTWPANGEVDILEQVNLATNNQVVLHTSDNCTMTSGEALSPIVDVKTNKAGSGNCAVPYSSSGCPVQASVPNNYGDAFNKNGGGYYVMQWTGDFIKVWFFSRATISSAVESTLEDEFPDVSKLGTPQAAFLGNPGCDVDSHFKSHRLVFDTTFCGDWAGNAYPQDGSCPLVPGKQAFESCAMYVGANPSAFKESYWEINAIRVYNENPNYKPSGNNSTSSSSSGTSTSSTSTVPYGNGTISTVTGPTGSGSVRTTSSTSTRITTSSAPFGNGTTSTTPRPGPTGTGSISTSSRSSSDPGRNSTSSTMSRTSSSMSRNSTSSTISTSSSMRSNSTTTSTRSRSTSMSRSRNSTITTLTSSTTAPTSKQTITTVIVSSYVDVCPTGLTTKTVTQTLTYCPGDQTSGAPPPGFTTKVTVCTACATTGPVTLTVPVTTTPVSTTRTRTRSSSLSSATSVPVTSIVYTTKIYTVTACPSTVPNCPASQSSTYVITSVGSTTTVFYSVPPPVMVSSSSTRSRRSSSSSASSSTPSVTSYPVTATTVIVSTATIVPVCSTCTGQTTVVPPPPATTACSTCNNGGSVTSVISLPPPAVSSPATSATPCSTCAAITTSPVIKVQTQTLVSNTTATATGSAKTTPTSVVLFLGAATKVDGGMSVVVAAVMGVVALLML